MDLFFSLFPIVLIISAGVLARKLHILRSEDAQVFFKFIINFAFPSLIFIKVHQLDISYNDLGVLLVGWCVVTAALGAGYMTGKALGFSKQTSALIAFMSAFGNTSMLGFPIVNSLYGSRGLSYALLFDQVSSFLPLITLGSAWLIWSNRATSATGSLKRYIAFAPLSALLAALLFKPLPLPGFLGETLELLGYTILPLGLFGIGLTLQLYDMRTYWRPVGLILVLKMVAIPLIVILLVTWFVPVATLYWKTAVMEIAMPPMVLAAIMASHAGLHRSIALSAASAGILLSFVTIPLIYTLMQSL